MPKEIIVPDNVYPAKGYSQAIKVGNTIYVAGQVAFDEQRNMVGEGDVVGQTERVYENLKRVLEAAGATMSDVVSMRVYTVDLDGFKKTGEIRRKYFGNHRPPMTSIGIAELYDPGALIEVEAIAVLD